MNNWQRAIFSLRKNDPMLLLVVALLAPPAITHLLRKGNWRTRAARVVGLETRLQSQNVRLSLTITVTS
jgi:hypothetical protein